jgi:hypothetical protein
VFAPFLGVNGRIGGDHSEVYERALAENTPGVRDQAHATHDLDILVGDALAPLAGRNNGEDPVSAEN